MSSGSARGYNRLARVYETLERLAFGDLLMEARTCLLADLDPPAKILIVGEGDGRMLERVLEYFPNAYVDCAEQSQAMISESQKRVSSSKVRWLRRDITTFQPERASYDLIVTTFILDSFVGETLSELVKSLVEGLKPAGQWYYADFAVPERGWVRVRAQLWLTLMYAFFRWQTGLKVNSLENPMPHLEHKLNLTQERFLSSGLLVTRIYTSQFTPLIDTRPS